MASANFTDINCRKFITNIYPATIFNIIVENCGISSQNKFNVTIEQLDNPYIVQIRINDNNDQTKIFSCTIDNYLYEKIKLEQSLHVTFPGFIDHLVKIFESCRKGELNLLLMFEESTIMLQFFEKRSFRNLVHLFLPMERATTDAILFHFNQNLRTLQEQTAQATNQCQRLQKEIITKDNCLADLKEELTKQQNIYHDKENVLINRCKQDVARLELTVSNLKDHQESEDKRHKNNISNLKDQLQSVLKEKLRLTDNLKEEQNDKELLREELKIIKAKNAILIEKNDNILSELKTQQSRDRKHEMIGNETRKQINDLLEKIKISEKQKSELSAELEAEKNICQSKRNGLQIATDEISKANSIILKQNKIIDELRKKIDYKNEKTTKQDLLLQEKFKENNNLKLKLDKILKEYEGYFENNQLFSNQIVSLQDAVDGIEEKYNKKINDLKNRLTNLPPSASTQSNCILKTSRY